MSEIDIERSAHILLSEADFMDTPREYASATSAPAPASGAVVLSYYRRYARECQIAAKHAANEKQRSELPKMIQAWSDFASQHERMIHEPAKDYPSAVCRSVKAWM